MQMDGRSKVDVDYKASAQFDLAIDIVKRLKYNCDIDTIAGKVIVYDDMGRMVFIIRRSEY